MAVRSCSFFGGRREQVRTVKLSISLLPFPSANFGLGSTVNHPGSPPFP